MANSNAFVPFGTGVGANVLSPAAYAALTARTQGFQSGVASSAVVNSAMRQAAFGTTALAQFLADYGPSNVADDGVVLNFETQIHQTLNRVVGRWPWVGPFGGSANALTCTLSPAPDSIAPGHKIRGFATARNTGPTTVTVLGSTYPITLSDGTAFVGGEFTLNQEIELTAYGLLTTVTSFVMSSPLPVSYFTGTFVPIIPQLIWYVDTALGVDDTFHGRAGGSSAFRSIQYAVNYCAKYFSVSTVTINVAAGTYTGFAVGRSLIAAWNIVGVSGAGATFVNQTSSTNGGTSDFCAIWTAGCQVTVSGFTVTAYLYGFYSGLAGTLYIYNCNAGSCTFGQFLANLAGNIWLLNTSTSTSACAITLSGTSQNAFIVSSGASINCGYTDPGSTNPVTITFSGATYVGSTVGAVSGGAISFAPGMVTWGGAPASPYRFGINSWGSIATNGAAYSWIPGQGVASNGGTNTMAACGLVGVVTANGVTSNAGSYL